MAEVSASSRDVRIELTAPEWSAQLTEMGPECRDVYFTPEYHRLHEINGDGEPFGSVARSGPSTLLIAGLKSSIVAPEGSPSFLWDLQTCNGYGGPVASGPNDPRLFDQAWEKWRIECQKSRMVAAFFRLHPLLENDRWLPSDAEIRLDRKTVFVDLTSGIEDQWRRAASQHRNMVRKATREGVRVRWNESRDWDAFTELYTGAMQRLSAPDRLQFSQSYFEMLRVLPGANLALVRQGEDAVAGSIFLFGVLWGHYHLSARVPDAPNYLSNCILQSAFERAADKGLPGIHLGGGKTPATDDSLLKFKTSTGGRHLDFKVALVVVDRKEFSRLCQQWEGRAGERPHWLLGYRQRNPVEMHGISSRV